jgi:hypothetical protein
MPFHSACWLALGRVYHGGAEGLATALRVVSHRTGIPVVVVAALALVISYRVARRAARLAVEMGVALGLVLVATKMGWIRW